MLDDGAARREIAMQHRHRAFRLDRTLSRANNILARHLLGAGHDIAQARAGDGFGIEVDEVAELLHQFRHAAGMVEMLHVMRARRLEVDQHRHFAAELVEGFEIDAMFGAVGDRGQMNEPVGRPTRSPAIRLARCGTPPASATRSGAGLSPLPSRRRPCRWLPPSESVRHAAPEWSHSSAMTGPSIP